MDTDERIIQALKEYYGSSRNEDFINEVAEAIDSISYIILEVYGENPIES